MVEFGKVKKKKRKEKRKNTGKCLQGLLFANDLKIITPRKKVEVEFLGINFYSYVDDVTKNLRMPFNVTSRDIIHY